MEIYVEKLRNRAIGGVIKYIKLPYLTECEINLPKIKDQDEFGNLIRVILAARATQKSAMDAVEGLFTSLQHRAFRGEL